MTPISILQNKIENLMVDSDMDEELQQKIMGLMKTLNRLKKDRSFPAAYFRG